MNRPTQRPSLTRTSARRLLCAVPAAIFALSCSEVSGPSDRVTRVEVNLQSSTLLVGTNAQAAARAFDIDGAEVTGVSATWRSSAPHIVTVDASGVLRGIELGSALITATIGQVDGTATVTIVPLPVVSVSLLPGGGTLERGQSLQLSATLRDQFGEILVGRSVTWTSSASGVASVNESGFVTAHAAGTAVITATSEGQSASVTINVIVVLVPGGPEIDSVTPALLVPGSTARIYGRLLGPTISENEVRIAGVLAQVMQASGTELEIRVPQSAQLGCNPTRNVFVQVARGSAAVTHLHPLQSLPLRTLQRGESVVLSALSDSRCLELAATGGRYIVTVYNTSTQASLNTQAGFRFRGIRGLPGPGEPIAAAAAASSVPAFAQEQAVPIAHPEELGALLEDASERARAAAHERILAANLDVLRRAGPPAAASAPAAVTQVAHQSAPGTILPFRIPNVGGFLSGGLDFCVSNFPVNARVVYNGTRAIIVEDTVKTFDGKATFAGQMDDRYRDIGEEFDQLMFGVVQSNFANPLRMDSQLDNNGKIVMLFSPRINTFSGVAGFVVTCDFFSQTTFPSSNRAEVFYAVVPTDPGSAFSGNTQAQWYRTIRSTVVHETKHIAAFANRIADFGSSLEESWLEEGTARHAEEIWARTAAYDGLAQLSNADYARTLFCDVRPAGNSGGALCVGKPWAMFRHFGQGGLYDYLIDNELRSPLGPRQGIVEGSYYATAWSLVRWAADHHGTGEAAFLSSLVRTAQSGVVNLTGRAGRSWAEMLGEWSLALYADDFPGLTPVNPRLTFPSWNLRAIFLGMNNDLPSTFPRPFPLVPRNTSFGDFAINVPIVAAGSFAAFEIVGQQTGRQFLELLNQNGGEPSAALRMAILRIN